MSVCVCVCVRACLCACLCMHMHVCTKHTSTQCCNFLPRVEEERWKKHLFIFYSELLDTFSTWAFTWLQWQISCLYNRCSRNDKSLDKCIEEVMWEIWQYNKCDLSHEGNMETCLFSQLFLFLDFIYNCNVKR